VARRRGCGDAGGRGGAVTPEGENGFDHGVSGSGGRGGTVDRFFFGAALGGRLRLRDIQDWGYWNPKGLVYWDESHIDSVPRLALIGRKIWSAPELDDAIAASLDLPGIQALWIHESLVPDVRQRWKAARRAVRNRLEARASVAVAVVAVAGCLTGLIAVAQAPSKNAPVEARHHEPARILTLRGATVESPSPRAGTGEAVQPNSPVRLAAPRHQQAAGPRPRAAYAVTVGTFASPAHADRMRHLVQRKGYIVQIVPRGTLSQVVTRSYPSRAQAERVARGLAGAGLPARLTSWFSL